MFEYLVVFLITLCVITASVLLHVRLSVPRYRIERADLRELLEQAIAGRAKVDRWELVTGITIRHDEQLATWQRRCREIGEQMNTPNRQSGAPACRFPPTAIEALQAVLLEMDTAEDHMIERRF